MIPLLVLAGVLAVAVVVSTERALREDSVVVERIDVGSTVTAEAIPSAWNEPMRTRIETSRGSFITVGSRSVLKGRQAYLSVRQSDRKYLEIEGEPFGWLVY